MNELASFGVKLGDGLGDLAENGVGDGEDGHDG